MSININVRRNLSTRDELACLGKEKIGENLNMWSDCEDDQSSLSSLIKRCSLSSRNHFNPPCDGVEIGTYLGVKENFRYVADGRDREHEDLMNATKIISLIENDIMPSSNLPKEKNVNQAFRALKHCILPDVPLAKINKIESSDENLNSNTLTVFNKLQKTDPGDYVVEQQQNSAISPRILISKKFDSAVKLLEECKLLEIEIYDLKKSMLQSKTDKLSSEEIQSIEDKLFMLEEKFMEQKSSICLILSKTIDQIKSGGELSADIQQSSEFINKNSRELKDEIKKLESDFEKQSLYETPRKNKLEFCSIKDLLQNPKTSSQSSIADFVKDGFLNGMKGKEALKYLESTIQSKRNDMLAILRKSKTDNTPNLCSKEKSRHKARSSADYSLTDMLVGLETERQSVGTKFYKKENTERNKNDFLSFSTQSSKLAEILAEDAKTDNLPNLLEDKSWSDSESFAANFDMLLSETVHVLDKLQKPAIQPNYVSCIKDMIHQRNISKDLLRTELLGQ